MVANDSVSVSRQRQPRASWKNQIDFLISLIAYAIGLGNVWRFPYLCHRNGGGAFLIPYLLSWVLLAAPIFLMEVTLGQYFQTGIIGVFDSCPIFSGVAYATVIVSFLCNIYYCVIIAWALFYMFSSFTPLLPWQDCNHTWTDSGCLSASSWNLNSTTAESSVEQFWLRRVLQTSSRIEETGAVQWELFSILLLLWMAVYFTLWRGITKARKVVYFCAMFPYIALLVLLIRAVTLPNALHGIVSFLRPDLQRLLDPVVWKDAATQVFYSSGIGYGSLSALGSFNDFHHNCYRDSILICVINASTSFTCGIAVFSILGHMAVLMRKNIQEVVQSGVGLVFLAYPEAVITLPLPQLFSCLFFAMIVILGLDSQFCVVNGVVTTLTDQLSNVVKENGRKVFIALICVVSFLLGIPMVCQSGQFWVTLVDNFGAGGIPLIFIVFFESIALSFGFGAKRIHDALSEMLGYSPSLYWYYCWRYVVPALLLALFVFVVVLFKPLLYADNVPYAPWATILGILMSVSSMIAVPAYAVYFLCTAQKGTLRQRLVNGLRPKISGAMSVVLTVTETSAAAIAK